MKYLENRIAELAEGKKITYRGYVYWLNPVTRESINPRNGGQ